MRTTLKRGIGQAAGQNGNGHSAAPPLFGPIARYRQPDPPRRSVIGWILRGFGWLVVALAVVGAGVAGGAYLYGHESLNAVSAHTKDLTNVVKHHQLATVPPPSQPAIALVAGYDVRGAPHGANPYAGSNSDTLMLLRADPTNNTLSLLSFPRDLYVPIYCSGDTVYTHDRINSAWSTCRNNGPGATLDTVEQLTGLHINYLITLDFHAFTQIVDHLHGIYMNVDRRYYIAPNTGVSAINLLPGYQKLNGAQALSYVRYRHTDSDIYRTGRQQLFLDALKSRVKTISVLDALKVVGDLKHNVEIAKGGGGAVSPSELKSYLGLLDGLPAGHLFRNAIPLNDFNYFVTPGGADVESASSGAIAGAVHSFMYPDVRDAAAVNAQFGGKKQTPKKTSKQHKLAKSKISVLVLNAGRTAGEAENTSYRLMTHGYTTKTLPSGDQANAPKVQSNTVVYYDPVQPDAKQAAQQLAPLFGSNNAKVKQMTTAISDFASRAGNPLTVVAVGTSFGGTLTIPKPPKVLPKQPPQVSAGAAMTASALQKVYDEVHFPLMVPHLVAQGSTLSTEDGVRGFKPLKNQHEVAMTFNINGGDEYWQIEESTWNSAPILQKPTGTIPYRGGKLLLYSTGGNLQMVALRTGGATYWVVNTILNQLSNSTMIAIAKSLRPLHH